MTPQHFHTIPTSCAILPTTDGQAQLDVGGKVVNKSHAKRTAKVWTLVFLAVRKCSHCTSASNWDSKAWKFSHAELKSYACALRYVPAKFYYSNSRPHKRRTRKLCLNFGWEWSGHAGPAGPVPAPMHTKKLSTSYSICIE